MTLFFNKSIEQFNVKDISQRFYKIDSSRSIKAPLTKDDFVLELDAIEPINSILIVDDIIDEGATLNIFLEKLSDLKLISNATQVKMACIYNNRKSNKTNPMNEFRSL